MLFLCTSFLMLFLSLSKGSGSESTNRVLNQTIPERVNRREMSVKCLQCLCVGNTNCMQEHDCADGYCGPFQLCEEYWIDAGKLGKSFEECALNYTCAEKTVVRFMNRFGDDCDGDGMITCDDYARIHFQERCLGQLFEV